MKDLRRIVGIIVIASFSVAALLGILALLGGGVFGETEGKVLLTTVTVGATSLAVLCHLAVADHRWAAVGLFGGVTALVCAATALWWVWFPPQWPDEGPWQLFLTTLILALTLAQASLLIAAADRDRLRVGLLATLGLAGVVAAMLIVPILGDGFPDEDGYWRVFGIVAILDVLGTIVLIAIAALQRRTPPTPAACPPTVLGLSLVVTDRIAAMAAERRTTPDALVTEALDALAAPVDH